MAIATALALVLVNPVGGGVAAGFDVGPNPFAGGQHRGADLRAAPGVPVRAACGGRVVVAGRVGSSGPLVTIRCGRWRVTHMPMATIAVRAGAVIPRGTRLGTVGASHDHAGLHLGVRRDGRRFGYVDPVPLFSSPPVTPPPVRPRRLDRHRPPRQPIAERPRPVLTPRAAPVQPVHGRGLAPWPAWAGLALVLAGAGIRMRGAASLRRPPWRSTSPRRSTT
jgi:murein DD-endopeptidase MepM/ murein hydrolase activator NlpD